MSAPTADDARHSLFASLRIRNYRLFFTGALVSNIGTWMGRVGQDWLVLTELTDHSSVSLGVVTALQFAPVALLAPFAGAVADRYPKRRTLMVTQALLAVTSAVLAVLALGGWAQLWHVYALALAQGVVTAFDNPTRQAFASEIVPLNLLTNAVGLNSASFNAARLVGPGLAGLIIAWWGTGWAMVVNTASFVAVLLAVWRMNPRELDPAPQRRGRGAIREGFRYVRGRPDIQRTMLIVFVLGTFGMNFQITNALMATTVFGKGAQEYGVLGSIMAIGSLTAALLTAKRPRPRNRIILVSLGAFAVSATALALAPTYWAYAVLLVPTGLTALTVMTTANTSVQMSVDPAMRGRVMSLYMAIFMGGTPLGSPIIGWIGDAWGARWTILVGGIACAAAFGYVAWQMYVREGWRIRPDRRELFWFDARQTGPGIAPVADPETSEVSA